MSDEINIDKDVYRWIPALKEHLAGKECYCPICDSKEIRVHEQFIDGVGFVLIECLKCGKSGYFSRVIRK